VSLLFLTFAVTFGYVARHPRRLELAVLISVFIDEKPSCCCFANETENMTGAEVFAKYAPSE
jgi:hypothetical protein